MFSFFVFIFFRFIVSCCAAANSPPSFVYPMADKRNCRNAILKYFVWFPSHESLKPAMKDALKNILGFLRRCFFSFSFTPRFNAAAEAYKNRISGWNRPLFTQNDFQKPSVVSKSRHCSGNKGWWGGEREQIGSLSLAGLLLMASSWWHCL